MRFLLVFSLINPFFLFSTSFGQNKDALEYIKENSAPIDTADYRISDTGYLKKALANKRIICMGEATHGTHEFQCIKSSIFKFLATQMGYKLFGIEAGFTECEKVNNYVLYGHGDAKQAIQGMIFWTWNTREIYDLVQWMRAYNKDRPEADKIKFFGFDMQNTQGTIEQIAKRLNKLDSGYFNTHFELLLDQFNKRPTVNRHLTDGVKTMLVQLDNYVTEQESNLSSLFPKENPKQLHNYIRLLKQNFDLAETMTKIRNRGALANEVRDRCMAENVKYILDQEGEHSKIMLWTHNVHASKVANISGAMGQYLKSVYDNQYYAIGFDFNRGSFRAVDIIKKELTIFNLNDARTGSCANLLAGLHMPEFFFDMDAAVNKNSTASKFFTAKLLQRNFGWGVDDKTKEDSYVVDKLYNRFDGLIFVNESSPTIPLN